MDAQSIIAYVIVAIAAVFLVKKFLLPKKKKAGCGSNDDCNCH